MLRHIPNALTASRLLLALVFFTLLSRYQYREPADLVLLHAAFLIYLIALITDFLDGFLARRWNVEGAFGRLIDPFVDKVLVLGAFIFFAGKNFTVPYPNAGETPANVQTITGVAPWMVVLMLARELLITTLRGSSESGGEGFGAQFSGKLKMTLQSITILVVLLYVNYLPGLKRLGYDGYASAFRTLCIYATVIITVVSGLLYVRRAVALYRSKRLNV